MKNFNLYLFHIELTWNEFTEKKTIVAMDMNAFHNFLIQYPTFSPIKVHVIYQEIIEIKAVKDKLSHGLFQQFFQKHDLLEYDEHLPYDSDIQKNSVLKNFLFSQNQYQPQNHFELLLAQYNILQAYYEQKINFFVQVIHTEYSREFGEKIFNNQYETKHIDYDLFTTGKNRYHSSHIYSSNTKEKVIQFSGINDKKELFEWKLN